MPPKRCVNPVTAWWWHTARVDEQQVAEVFAAMGDPTRLRLLRLLLDDEHCVTQCTDALGLAQSGVSKHLARLVAVGLVTRRPAGRRTYHRVSDPAAVRALLDGARPLIASGAH